MIGQREVLAAQQPGGVHHGLDRGSAVGPVAVAVQVAAERGKQLVPARHQRLGPPASQPTQVLRHVAVERLPDDLEGPVADPFGPLQPAVPDPGRQFLRLEAGDDSGGFPERLDLERRGELAFEPEGNLIEGVDGIHGTILHPSRGAGDPGASACRAALGSGGSF